MIAFALAVFLLIATPGPGVLSTAGVGSGFGFRAGLAYVGGLWAGNMLVALMVTSGLAALVLAIPWARVLLLGASTLYLCWIALRIAASGTRLGFIHAEVPPGFWGGFALQPINPKAYVVHTTLMGGFSFLPQNPAAEIVIKLVLMNLVWIPLHLAWLWAGVALNRLDLRPAMHRAINIFMALAMLAVVALAVLNAPVPAG